jgi:DNA transformation protein
MPVSPDYRAHVLEQLGRVAPVTSRSMFGGVGLYADGLFFALIDDDTVYFKVDDANRGDYLAVGSQPFMPMGDDKPMGYYSLPEEILEDEGRLHEWAAKSIAVAERAKSKRQPKAKSSQKA